MTMANPSPDPTLTESAAGAVGKAADGGVDTAGRQDEQASDDESSRLSQSTASEDGAGIGEQDGGSISSTDDDAKFASGDSDVSLDKSGEEEEEEQSSDGGGDEGGTDGAMPVGDTSDDLHALLAFSKKRLETAKPVTTEPGAEAEESGEEEGTNGTEEGGEDGGDAAPEQKDTDGLKGAEVKSTGSEALTESSTQESEEEDQEAVVTETAADATSAAAAAAAVPEDDGTGASNGNDDAPPQNRPGRDTNKELWALLSYSKQRLETGEHAAPSPPKPRQSKKKMGKTSSGVEDETEAQPDGQEATMDEADDEKKIEDESTLGAGKEERRSIKEVDSDEEEDSDSEEESDEEEDDSDEEDEDDDALMATPTPSFLKRFEAEDEGGSQNDNTDAAILSDAARSYADAILSVANEEAPGALSDEQMLEAMIVAEEAAQRGDERFSTFGSLDQLHRAKGAIRELAESMKAEAEKTAESARDVRRRGGEKSRPVINFVRNKFKEIQSTCAQVDGNPKK